MRYDFNTKSAKPVDLGVWSDSSKKIASLTDESLIIYNTEDGSGFFEKLQRWRH